MACLVDSKGELCPNYVQFDSAPCPKFLYINQFKTSKNYDNKSIILGKRDF